MDMIFQAWSSGFLQASQQWSRSALVPTKHTCSWILIGRCKCRYLQWLLGNLSTEFELRDVCCHNAIHRPDPDCRLVENGCGGALRHCGLASSTQHVVFSDGGTARRASLDRAAGDRIVRPASPTSGGLNAARSSHARHRDRRPTGLGVAPGWCC